MDEQGTSRSSAAVRLAYVDGLRGLAIGSVVLFHTWEHLGLGTGTPLRWLLAQGSEGVSLFLVISGFCLSLPALERLKAGVTQWFVPSDFLARRCLRILPPYYVALALFALIKVAGARNQVLNFNTSDPAPNVPNLLTHIFLVHNLSSYIYSINGSFWSLALEWQWYLVFPLILVIVVRSRAAGLMVCAALALAWQQVTHDLWGIGALPERLFEFGCGVVVAYAVVYRWRISAWLLGGGLALALSLIYVPQSVAAWPAQLFPDGAVDHLLYGAAFGLLVLLGSGSRGVNAVLSWRPLVWLGLISYSTYLVHQPIANLAIDQLHRHISRSWSHPMLTLVVAADVGICAGFVFYMCIERFANLRSTKKRWIPVLLPWFVWADLIWRKSASTLRTVPVIAPPAPGVAPASHPRGTALASAPAGDGVSTEKPSE